METENLPVRIRRATEEDVSFLFSSWLKSYQNSTFARGIPGPIYFAEHHKVIEELLKTCEVIIACNEKDPTDIYAYLCAERVDGIFVLHYAYTKHTYRMMGLAKLLLNHFDHELGVAAIYTHNTRTGERIARKYGFAYSPYVAMTVAYRRRAENHKKRRDTAELELKHREMQTARLEQLKEEAQIMKGIEDETE